MKIKWMDSCCYVLFTVIWDTSAEIQTSDLESTHVRMWTGWYNTDNPMTGDGDDESVSSIRKKGYEICDGNSPIDAICRDVRAHATIFNSEISKLTKDMLHIPCNTRGLVCRNKDQRNSMCRDYEIRFECLSASELPAPENLGVIGVAVGLSVIAPILCVIIMHTVRMMKERRYPARQSLVGNSEQSVQTDLADMPPSYSLLFGENTTDEQSESTNINPVQISVTGSSGDVRLPTTRLSSCSLHSVTENLTHTSSREDDFVSNNVTSSSDNRTSSSWRSRFPNMHFSVFDLFHSSDQRSEPQSPDLSYAQTPPPTYIDAIIILGGETLILSENGDIGEKL